jgi:integrase
MENNNLLNYLRENNLLKSEEIVSQNDLKIFESLGVKTLILKVKGFSHEGYKILSKILNRSKRIKYPSKNKRLYGDSKKVLSDEHFNSILKIMKSKSAIMCFLIQRRMGLGISDVVQIQFLNFDFENWTFLYKREKTGKFIQLGVPKSIREKLTSFILDIHKISNLEDLKHSVKYLFPSLNKHKIYGCKASFISKDWLRNYFREKLKKLCLDSVYAECGGYNPETEQKIRRNLYDYSTHTLRRSFANDLYSVSNNNIDLVRKALGHSSIKTTQTYITTDIENVYSAMENL